MKGDPAGRVTTLKPAYPEEGGRGPGVGGPGGRAAGAVEAAEAGASGRDSYRWTRKTAWEARAPMASFRR